jgi:enoyl-CoA hydratase/carnithine racemase
MNAISQKVLEELLSAFDEVDKDDDVRVVIITGAGKGFCSGADVTEMPGGGAPQQDVVGSRVIRRLRMIRKPVIAMVNGAAVGGGCALALACDMRVGSQNSRFMNAFIRRGLSSGWAGPWLYPRLMGLGKAMEILLTGDFLEAKEAERLGVLNKLVPADELEKETMALAAKIAKGPPVAIKETKRRVYEGLERISKLVFRAPTKVR